MPENFHLGASQGDTVVSVLKTSKPFWRAPARDVEGQTFRQATHVQSRISSLICAPEKPQIRPLVAPRPRPVAGGTGAKTPSALR